MGRKKKVHYKIVLLTNGEMSYMIAKKADREAMLNKFNTLKEESDKVIFPKRYINRKGIFPCKHELLLLKDYGLHSNVSEEQKFDDKWRIIKRIDYNIEETFYMYGYDKKNERKTTADIAELLLSQKEKRLREIIAVNNKLLIYNDDFFDMVICKCPQDARRLNRTLYAIFSKVRGIRFIFIGTAKREHLTFLYDMIQEETGWSRIKVQRTNTRP